MTLSEQPFSKPAVCRVSLEVPPRIHDIARTWGCVVEASLEEE
jgi:hypothetical protein